VPTPFLNASKSINPHPSSATESRSTKWIIFWTARCSEENLNTWFTGRDMGSKRPNGDQQRMSKVQGGWYLSSCEGDTMTMPLLLPEIPLMGKLTGYEHASTLAHWLSSEIKLRSTQCAGYRYIHP